MIQDSLLSRLAHLTSVLPVDGILMELIHDTDARICNGLHARSYIYMSIYSLRTSEARRTRFVENNLLPQTADCRKHCKFVFNEVARRHLISLSTLLRPGLCLYRLANKYVVCTAQLCYVARGYYIYTTIIPRLTDLHLQLIIAANTCTVRCMHVNMRVSHYHLVAESLPSFET